MSDDLIQFPYVLIATPSTYKEGRGGTFTLQECFNRLVLPPPQEGLDTEEVTITLLLCAGEAPGTYEAAVEYRGPIGRSVQMQGGPITFTQPYHQEKVHLRALAARLPGWHFYDVRLNGRLVVRVPLEVEIREKMPPLGRMAPYPGRMSRN